MSDDYFSPFENVQYGVRGGKRRYSHDKYRGEDHDEYGRGDRRHDIHHDDSDPLEMVGSFARSIMHSKPLMIILALGLVVVSVITVILIVLFYPFLLKVWHFFVNNGLKGILDLIQPILSLIWQGK